MTGIKQFLEEVLWEREKNCRNSNKLLGGWDRGKWLLLNSYRSQECFAGSASFKSPRNPVTEELPSCPLVEKMRSKRLPVPQRLPWEETEKEPEHRFYLGHQPTFLLDPCAGCTSQSLLNVFICEMGTMLPLSLSNNEKSILTSLEVLGIWYVLNVCGMAIRTGHIIVVCKCGRQPPRRSPGIPTSWGSHPC